MKKLILKWLFGTDDIKDYLELLHDAQKYCKRLIEVHNDHIKTLETAKEDLDTIRKLIRVCENHGIDVDKEIKQIKLYK